DRSVRRESATSRRGDHSLDVAPRLVEVERQRRRGFVRTVEDTLRGRRQSVEESGQLHGSMRVEDRALDRVIRSRVRVVAHYGGERMPRDEDLAGGGAYAARERRRADGGPRGGGGGRTLRTIRGW